MPPTWASSATVVALNVEELSGPSLPWFVAYSSLVPTTISGCPSPVRSPTAGVSMIAPWFSASPAFELKVTACVWESTDATLVGSTTSTGNPGTGEPSSFHA